MKSIAWFALALLASSAQAQDRMGCNPAIEQALRDAGPQTTVLGAVASQHCKPWPGSAGVTAAVMAFEGGKGATDGESTWEVVVALLDVGASRVTHARWTYVESDALTGIGEHSLRLDTAPFQLTPQLRALGLRFHSTASGSRYAEAYWGNELTLFVPEGRTLRPVLSLATEAQAQVGPQDDQWQTAKLTLAMGRAGATGWSDIIVSDSAEGANQRAHRWTYRYERTAYRLSDKQPPFWAGYPTSLNW